MRTGPQITTAIRLTSQHARPGITAHLRLVSLIRGRGVVRPGTPPGWALADHVSADEPQARRLPVPGAPGPRGPGTMPPPASELELNAFISQLRTEVSRDRCVSGRATRPPILGG